MTVIVDCFEGVKRKRFFSHNTQIGPAFFLFFFFAVYYINASPVCLVNSRSVDLTRKATSEKSHTEDSSINKMPTKESGADDLTVPTFYIVSK